MKAIQTVLCYKRIDLKDWVRSVVKCISVEFVRQESVEHSHVEGLSSANHRCLRKQKTGLNVERINKLGINRNDICVLLDFLESNQNIKQLDHIFQAKFVVGMSQPHDLFKS